MPSRIWRPYTQEKTALPALEIERAEGAYLYSAQGQKILDAISSWWVITHGHCQPEICEAVSRQMQRLDQVLFANFTHAASEELAERLVQLTQPSLTRVFLSDNGSTAVEVALKMALQYWPQSGNTRKNKFIAFAEAYHGDTVGAMSVSGAHVYSRPYSPFTFEVLRAKHPRLSTASSEEFVKDFAYLLSRHHALVAGVIVEPLVQGAAGMVMWPTASIRRVAELCRQYGVLLIFDEVMTGFGRTGSLFAMDRVGVQPDLLCLSKGLTGGVLPLGATLATDKVFAAFYSADKEKMLFHGHSFTGNPTSCAAAVANLKLFAKPGALAHLESIEAVHRQAGEAARSKLPVKDARACGSIGALELDLKEVGYTSYFTERVSRLALNEGVFVRPLGSVLYLLPPYATTAEEVRNAWEVMVHAAQRALET